MTRARTLADMISDGVIGTTELADDAITPVKLDETGNYTIAQLDVNGTLTSDGLTVDTDTLYVDSTNNRVGIGTLAPTQRVQIGELQGKTFVIDQSVSNTTRLANDYSAILEAGGGYDLKLRSNGNASFGSIVFETAGTTDRMKIASNGDISFYEDTGTTPKFFWDASAERLGIGTTSPSEKLDVAGTIEADKIVAAVGGSGTSLSADRYMGVRNTGGDAHMQVICADTTGLAGITFGRNSDNVAAGMAYDASNHGVLFYGHDYAERMRIDSSGNLLVGTTDTQPPTNSDVSGIALRSDGKIAASRDNGIAADFNNNNAGNIAWFRKNGTVVATVSTRTGGGDAPYFGGYTNADTGIAFSSARMYPVTSSGVVANGTRDLGNFDAKWKDLYLSGGIQFDSRSNKLDDYEEGTYEVTLIPQYGTITMDSTRNLAKYVKIGSLVYVSGQVRLSSVSSPSGSHVNFSLPFANASGDELSSHTWNSVVVYNFGYTNRDQGLWVYDNNSFARFLDSHYNYVTPSNFSGDEEIIFSLTYRTDA